MSEETTTQDTTPQHFDMLEHFQAKMDEAVASPPEDLDSLEDPDDEGPTDEPGEGADEGELPPEDGSPEPGDDEEPLPAEADGPLPEDEGDDQPEPEPEGEASATVSPEMEELKLRLVAQEQRTQQLLQLLYAERKAAEAQRQQPVPKEEIPLDAMKLALFGANDEAWAPYGPDVRRKAESRAREEMDRMARYALDPALQYKEVIAPLVERELAQRLQPYQNQVEQQNVVQIFERHASDLSQEQMLRVGEVFKDMPGAASRDWGTLDKAMSYAVRLVKAESKEETIATREKKVADAERQKQANRKAARRSRPRGRGRAPAKDAPKLDLTKEDLVSYSRRLMDEGI